MFKKELHTWRNQPPKGDKMSCGSHHDVDEGSFSYTLTCTLRAGHDGPHRAGIGDGKFSAMWDGYPSNLPELGFHLLGEGQTFLWTADTAARLSLSGNMPKVCHSYDVNRRVVTYQGISSSGRLTNVRKKSLDCDHAWIPALRPPSFSFSFDDAGVDFFADLGL